MPVAFWPLPQSSPGMVESIALRGGGLSLRKQRFSVQIRAADGSRCASRDLGAVVARDTGSLHGAVALDAHRGKEAQDGRGRAHQAEHLAARAGPGDVEKKR